MNLTVENVESGSPGLLSAENVDNFFVAVNAPALGNGRRIDEGCAGIFDDNGFFMPNVGILDSII